MKFNLTPIPSLFTALVTLVRGATEQSVTLYARSGSFADVQAVRRAVYPGWGITELLF